jgi:hypothetical protein
MRFEAANRSPADLDRALHERLLMRGGSIASRQRQLVMLTSRMAGVSRATARDISPEENALMSTIAFAEE